VQTYSDLTDLRELQSFLFSALFVVVVLVVGPISTAAIKVYCTLIPMEFLHSSPEALHTKRRERPLLAKDGTKAKEFS
jgi:hypothetical protein